MNKPVILLLLLLSLPPLRADEGMWMLGNLNRDTRQLMEELGLEMPVNQLYAPDAPSLKDAVVSFGGFCSGVVVSADGLVFTNHHCGFDAIQQHSTLAHDYLKEGFVAANLSEELPNPDLHVSFLVRTEKVTERVLSVVKPTMSEYERQAAIDSISQLIQHEVFTRDSLLRGAVDAYYGGNEFYLSIYKDYNDVRLVFAPPSSVGKFGGDTDNWVWPRHTGDFSVFRIYAGKENKPAFYASDNVPYRPTYVAPISLNGYKEGSFCMTLGYPGKTERYLSSWGVEEQVAADHAAMIEVRGRKQAIWKRAMEAADSTRISYASKYASSANYWKNSIGTNRSVKVLHVIEKKRETERELMRWIQQNPDERASYLQILTDLELNYKNRFATRRALAFLGESFMNAPELVELALEILNFDFEDEAANVERKMSCLLNKYANLDLSIDKEVFVAMLKTYREAVDSTFLPEVYTTIRTDYKNNDQLYADFLYANSSLTTPAALNRLAARDSTFSLFKDPVAVLALDLLVAFFDMNQSVEQESAEIERLERLFNAAVREMYADRNFYPDANSTMRLSLGMVGSYSPRDGILFDYYTTTKGIFQKVKAHSGDTDFYVEPRLLDLLASGQFGKYADEKGEMNVCFISGNDITGGSSGSGMFDGNGKLIGLAFDGNWEGMGGDLVFEPQFQKCVGVDIRYVLFLIEHYGKASHLISELNL